MTETGLVGLAAFVALVAAWARTAWSLARRTDGPAWVRSHGLLMLAVVVSYLASAMFHDLTLLPTQQWLLFTLAGLTVNLWLKSVEQGARSTEISLLVAPCFLLPLALKSREPPMTDSIDLFGMQISRVTMHDAIEQSPAWPSATAAMRGSFRNCSGTSGAESIPERSRAVIFAVMPNSNILVIAVDGLRAAALGGYGNTAFPTPALDQFAAESFLFDECFANATQLASIYRALWTSVHPLRDATQSADAVAAPLPRWLADNGYSTTLVTDEPAIAALPAASGFDQCVSIGECPDFAESSQQNGTVPLSPNARADDLAATSMARLFAAVSEHTQPLPGDQRAPRFVWVHARGMYGPWDGPLELQDHLLEREEGDPSPCDAIEPPEVLLDAESDPDAAFRASCGYAAQVIVLDACVEGLLELLDDVASHEQWLLVLCGVRGFPLGEHGRIGGVDERLFTEQLHVPLLWRFPDGTGRLARSRELASHLDILPTLLDWIGGGLCAGLTTPHRPWHGQETGHNDETGDLDGDSLLALFRQHTSPRRQRVVAASTTGCRSLRTADWCLRYEPAGLSGDPTSASATVREGEPRRCALYVRPDDRWEANDVADLCPDEVEALNELLLG